MKLSNDYFSFYQVGPKLKRPSETIRAYDPSHGCIREISAWTSSNSTTGKGNNMRRAYLIFLLLLIVVGVLPGACLAQRVKTQPGRMVVCMIQLEHADAEHLASVLRPFLSPDGSLSPYTPTNTLIIKDRQSVVNMVSEIIKGRPCNETSQSPGN